MRQIGGGFGSGPAPTGPLKSWVREELALGDDATVTVSELECSEPGCPPVETAVTVFAPGAEPYLVKNPQAGRRTGPVRPPCRAFLRQRALTLLPGGTREQDQISFSGDQ